MSSPENKSSLADLLRVHVKKRLDQKFDYSLATNRKQDILDFITENKSKLNESSSQIKNVRASMHNILESELKERGLHPESIGLKKNKSKSKLKYNSDMNPVITPSAQAGENDTTPKKQIQDPNQQGLQIMQPAYDEASVSATFSALFLTFRIAVPDIELLTDDEKSALGKMWLPAFNLYMSNEKWAVIGIPIMASLGIFLPKILEGRKKGKIRKSKLEGNLRQKEIDDKNERQQEQFKKEVKDIDNLSGLQQIKSTQEDPTLPKKE